MSWRVSVSRTQGAACRVRQSRNKVQCRCDRLFVQATRLPKVEMFPETPTHSQVPAKLVSAINTRFARFHRHIPLQADEALSAGFGESGKKFRKVGKRPDLGRLQFVPG